MKNLLWVLMVCLLTVPCYGADLEDKYTDKVTYTRYEVTFESLAARKLDYFGYLPNTVKGNTVLEYEENLDKWYDVDKKISLDELNRLLDKMGYEKATKVSIDELERVTGVSNHDLVNRDLIQELSRGDVYVFLGDLVELEEDEESNQEEFEELKQCTNLQKYGIYQSYLRLKSAVDEKDLEIWRENYRELADLALQNKSLYEKRRKELNYSFTFEGTPLKEIKSQVYKGELELNESDRIQAYSDIRIKGKTYDECMKKLNIALSYAPYNIRIETNDEVRALLLKDLKDIENFYRFSERFSVLKGQVKDIEIPMFFKDKIFMFTTYIDDENKDLVLNIGYDCYNSCVFLERELEGWLQYYEYDKVPELYKEWVKEIDKIEGKDERDYINKAAIYICNKTNYNYTAARNMDESENNVPETVHMVDGFLFNHNIVCDGYASVFQTIMYHNGIQAEMVEGMVPLGYHGWSRVKTGDKWYNVDVCWMDTDYHGYNYWFMKDDNVFKSRGWKPEWKYIEQDVLKNIG